MEEVGHWDDGERPLAYVEENDSESSDTADPLQVEMVAVATDSAGTEAPVQGSPSPRAAPTLDSVQIPEIVPGPKTCARGNPENMSNNVSADAIQASLNSALETSDMVGSFQNPWGDMSGGHFLSASSNAPNNSLGANSMMAPLFKTLTEQERNKLLTDMIINCIRRQSALWDSSDPSYGDSKYCQLLWNNIATVCGMDIRKLKSKWYNLKCTYKKEFIKCTTRGVSSKSPNFGAMSFLEGEIVLELKRESSEKDVVRQQLQRIQSANSQPAGSHVLLDSEDDKDDGEDEDDCVIVQSEQYLAARKTLCKTLNSDVLPSSRAAPSGSAGALATPPKPLRTVRPKGSTELNSKRLYNPPATSSNPSSESSPEVVPLDDSHTSTKKVVYSAAIEDKPIIKFSSPNPQMLIVSEGMPKNWNESESSTPTVLQQSARKSTSGASYRNLKSQNGIGSTSTPTNCLTQSTRNSTNLKSLVNAENTAWRIENPRTLEQNPSCSKPEHTKPTKEKTPETEPTVKLDRFVAEEDEIQIIKEVPGSSRKTNWAVAGPSTSKTGSKRVAQSTDQADPPKKRRSSDPKRVSPKRKVDKTRENSANEHFLLSLMCDVESLNNKQFRRLKKHSTSLAAMILDSRR